MKAYEKIYNLLTEAKVTIKKKAGSTRPTVGRFKSDKTTAIKTGETEAKQRRGRRGIVRHARATVGDSRTVFSRSQRSQDVEGQYRRGER